MIKAIIITTIIVIGILDVLLIIGCAKLERAREENERSNYETDK